MPLTSAELSRPGTAKAGDTLHSLVEQQVDRTPAAEAFRFRQQGTTYGRLELLANRIANRLIAEGVRPGDRVAVCLDRGVELVAALLGVMKAGACYVPVDPDYPAERVSFMARDCDARILLTQRSLVAQFEGIDSTRCLEDLDLAGAAADRPVVRCHPSSLAYLIYTSGSTGRPKATAIEHRAVANLIDWVGTAFSTRELDGVLASTSVCFDLSVFEIFATLACGGRFVLVRTVLEIGDLTPADAVRTVNTVPTAMSELVAAGVLPSTVETVALAGEPLPESLVQRLHRLPQVRRVLNLYGPSEDTTYSTWADLPAEAAGPPSIGVPVPGTRAYVLDETLAQLPAGRPGELYLSGPKLARGYLGRPGLTASKFVPDPWASAPGQRMYRTGDRVVRGPDQNLVFLGRSDDMVKLRGHRIELGEVTAVLSAAPGVLAAASKVVPGPSGDPRLVGYLVPERTGAAPTVAAVIEYARTRLPGYMVPKEFCWLESLPRTPNGKVDSRALPAPDRTGPAPTAAAEPAPTSAPGAGQLGDQVREVWQQVLGREISPGENFFALGGDSLLATRVAVRLRDTLGVPLSLTAVFQHPTVNRLAAWIQGLQGGPRTPASGAALPDGPLSSAQQRFWFLDQLNPGDTDYLVSVVLEIDGPVGLDPLAAALQDVVDAHPALRTSFGDHEGEPSQTVRPSARLVVDVVDLVPDQPEADQIRRRVQHQASGPMNLETAPLLRCAIVRRAGRPAAVVLTAHHIVFDGGSVEVLVRDLGHRYELRAAGPTRGPDPRPGPIDIERRHQAWLTGSAGVEAVGRIVDTLRGAPELLPLPTDLPRRADRGSGGGHLVSTLEPKSVRALTALAQAHQVTPYMVGMTVFALELARWAQVEDLVIGTAFAGRTSVEAEHAIGCFVNTVPIRLAVPPGATFQQLITQVRQAAIFAGAHQDVPLDLIVQRLNPPRTTAYNPVLQVAFGTRADRATARCADGAAISAEVVDSQTARLDLTLWLERRADGFRALWTYSTELFRSGTIAARNQDFQRRLQSAADQLPV